LAEASSGVTTTFVTSSGGPDEAKNIANAKAFYESIEKNDDKALGAFFSDDATVDDMALPSKGQKGKAAFFTMKQSWKSALGNFTTLPLYGQFAINDWVVTERVMKGPPSPNGSGLGAQLHCIDLSQWKDGKMTRFATYSNTLELIAEVGPRGKRR
jgi:hypothetical protein